MGRLVGLAWPSNPKDFPNEHGVAVPTSAKKLRELIQEVNATKLPSASINKTVIRCITDDTVPPLVHGILMEGGACDTKFLHLKRVLYNNTLYFDQGILCVGFLQHVPRHTLVTYWTSSLSHEISAEQAGAEPSHDATNVTKCHL